MRYSIIQFISILNMHSVYRCYFYISFFCANHLDFILPYLPILVNSPRLVQTLQKFVARKARKFISQGYRLLLPAYELTYIWNSYDVMPLVPLLRSLSTIELTIDNLDSVKDNQFYVNYWDDVCLAYLLRGVLLSKIAFPNNPEDEKACKNNKDNSTSTCATAIASFQYAIRKGACIKLDHYIVHFARFELGRLYTNMKEFGKARSEFQRVLDGGDGTEKRNGKYSLESMLLLRTYNAMVKLEGLERDLEWEREHENRSGNENGDLRENGIHERLSSG